MVHPQLWIFDFDTGSWSCVEADDGGKGNGWKGTGDGRGGDRGGSGGDRRGGPGPPAVFDHTATLVGSDHIMVVGGVMVGAALNSSVSLVAPETAGSWSFPWAPGFAFRFELASGRLSSVLQMYRPSRSPPPNDVVSGVDRPELHPGFKRGSIARGRCNSTSRNKLKNIIRGGSGLLEGKQGLGGGMLVISVVEYPLRRFKSARPVPSCDRHQALQVSS